jgi:hypothetical protein
MTLRGNDGLKYKSVSDKRGIYKWIQSDSVAKKTLKHKTSSSSKSYLIHDNGGRPYTVKDTGGIVEIYANKLDDKGELFPSILIMKQKYQRIFTGEIIHPETKKYGVLYNAGNTILLQITKSKYMFIGSSEGIYTFELAKGDEILKFASPIGNSDVPYPYAVGKDNTYLLIENVYLPNSELDDDEPYKQYYNHTGKHPNLKKKGHKLIAKKTLIDREKYW